MILMRRRNFIKSLIGTVVAGPSILSSVSLTPPPVHVAKVMYIGTEDLLLARMAKELQDEVDREIIADITRMVRSREHSSHLNFP